jgi:hypothetical protein
VSGFFGRRNTLRHPLDARGISDRRATVFLDDQAHVETPPSHPASECNLAILLATNRHCDRVD